MKNRSAPFAAVALSLSFAAPAAAAPMPGATYGGGQLPVSFRQGGNNMLLSAAVAADGRSVRLVGSLSVRCNRRPGAVQQFVVNGQTGPDGRLRAETATRNYLYAIKGSRPRGRATVDLGFDGATGGGTVRFVASFKAQGRRVRCDETLQVALRSTAGGPGAAGAAPAGAALFGGGSARYRGAAVPVALKLSADGRRVDPTQVGVPLRCASIGITDYLVNASPAMTVQPDGTFRSRERFSVRFRGGGRTTTKFRLDGRFTAQGATGTYSATSVARTPGRRSVRCSSGSISFTALR